MDSERIRLLETIRSQYERVAWTHKTHEKERELLTQRANAQRLLEVLFTTLTSITLLASLIDDRSITLIALFFAIPATFVAIYSLSSSPEREAESHRTTAKLILSERNQLELLIEKCMSKESSISDVRDNLEQIISRLDKVYMTAPNTRSKAYTIAHQALTEKNELGAISSEIDELLPQHLRMTSYIEDETVD